MKAIPLLAERINSIPGKFILNERLASSPIAQIFLCTLNNIKAVIRFDLPCASLLAIDRENEAMLLNQIEHLGLAPKILFHDSIKGMFIWEFLEGEQFILTPNTQASYLRSLGGSLAKVHESIISKNSIDIFSSSIHLYKRLLENSSHHALIKKTLSLYNKISQDGTSFVLSHNDLNAKNIIWNDQFLFLDWEYAGLNHPCFDIASLFKAQHFTEDQLCEFLIGYCGKADFFHLKTLKQWILFSDLLDEVWKISVNLLSQDNQHIGDMK